MRRAGETQPARTALAWQRTGLAVLVVAALLVRTAVVRDQPLLALPAGLVALVGLTLLGVLAPRRARSVRQAAETAGPGADRTSVRWATGLVVLTAVAALAVDLAGRTGDVTGR